MSKPLTSEYTNQAYGSWNHEHDRAAAMRLIVETSARNYEDTRLDVALRIGLCHRSAPGGQRQNSHCGKPRQNVRRVIDDSFVVIVVSMVIRRRAPRVRSGASSLLPVLRWHRER
jgi:hypothetical protein